MISKTLEAISTDDLTAFVSGGVREARDLEFKQIIPGNSDADKKEFLADVTSFANAGGGDIIYGMREEDGVAAEALGLTDFNEDTERLRLESIIRDGVAPRVPGINMWAVTGFSRGPILIMRIPRSWTGPHMVTFKGSSRFFSRSSNGKFQMDVTELRSAFEGTAELPTRIARWRDERLGRVVANEGPIRLNGNACLVMHLVPLESFGAEWRFHATDMKGLQVPFQPLGTNGWDHRLNIDGLVTFSRDRNDTELALNYTQLFRSGRVEAVTANVLTERDNAKWIASIWYEQEIIGTTSSYLKALKGLGVQPPIVFLLSITGCRGAYMYCDAWRSGYGSAPLDRDVVLFPEVIIESVDDDLPTNLRPVFDAVWNACGLPQSLNYDQDGKWNPRR